MDAAQLAYFRALQLKVADIKEEITNVVYACGAILGLGVVGNILALFIFLKKSLRNTSSGTFLTAIIILDLLFICLGAAPDLAFVAIEEDMGLKVGAGLCKVWTFCYRTLQCLSCWVLVAAAVDTFQQVLKPDQVAERNTITRARLIIAVLTIAAIVLNIWVLFGIDAIGRNAITGTVRVSQCGYSELKFLNFDTDENQYIFLVFCSILPAAFLLILSLLIIIKNLKLHMVVVDATVAQRCKLSSSIIVAISVMFILMEAPSSAMGSLFWSEVLVPFVTDPVGLMWRLFAKSILIFFGYTQHSIKFFICCAVSGDFRQDVKNMCNERLIFPITNKDSEKGNEEAGGEKNNKGAGMAKY